VVDRFVGDIAADYYVPERVLVRGGRDECVGGLSATYELIA
jgi:hypothetical protein